VIIAPLFYADNVICYGISEKGNADEVAFYRNSSGQIMHFIGIQVAKICILSELEYFYYLCINDIDCNHD